MVSETSPHPDAAKEPSPPAGGSGDVGERPRTPFSLAAILGLNEEDLAQPVSRAAPDEHRWEQLSLGVTPETGEATPSELRSGAASQPLSREVELIPGLDAPGAVEVPVYLAGRTLHEMVNSTPESSDVIAPASEASDEATQDPQVPTVSARPPAIAMPVSGKPRRKTEAPSANFAKADTGSVLWPTRKKPVTASVLPLECAKCGAPSEGDGRCAICGNDTAVPSKTRRTGMWHRMVASFIESDSQTVRTVGALVLAPGELTAALLTARGKRYASPVVLAAVSMLLFAIISGLASLRARPDRSLMIGTESTVERASGLVNAAPTNLAFDAPPDLLREVVTALNDLPWLWLPLMVFAVVAVLAAVGAFSGRVEHGELAFAAHFAFWYVLWWGLAVPLLLLAVKFGLEYAAAWEGVTRVRQLSDGRVAGLSETWNVVRGVTGSTGFHSALLGLDCCRGRSSPTDAPLMRPGCARSSPACCSRASPVLLLPLRLRQRPSPAGVSATLEATLQNGHLSLTTIP